MTSVQVGPLQCRTLREMVADSLRQAILNGKLKPGQRIMETEVSTEIGVSRATLRDALRLLERDGLVRIVPQRGASVIELSREDLIELHDLRGMLEGHAAARACEHITGAEAETLSGLCQEMQDLLPVDTRSRRAAFTVKDAEFHRQLIMASRSQYLIETLSVIEVRIRMIMATISMEGLGLAQAAAEHQSMLDPILRHDAIEAERLAREHIRGAKERFLSMLPCQREEQQQEGLP